MTAIPPSLPGLPVASAAPQPTGSAVLIGLLSEALASLPAESILPALVVKVTPLPLLPGQPPAFAALVQTPAGPAQFRLALPVSIGDHLQLAVPVEKSAAQNWQLLTVNDRAPPSAPQIGAQKTPAAIILPGKIDGSKIAGPSLAPAREAFQDGPLTASAAARGPGETARPTAPEGLPALLIKSALPSLPDGTPLQIKIVSIAAPAAPAPIGLPPDPTTPEIATGEIIVTERAPSGPLVDAPVSSSAQQVAEPATAATRATTPNSPPSAQQPVQDATQYATPTPKAFGAPFAVTPEAPAQTLPPRQEFQPAAPAAGNQATARLPGEPAAPSLRVEVLPNRDGESLLLRSPIGTIALPDPPARLTPATILHVEIIAQTAPPESDGPAAPASKPHWSATLPALRDEVAAQPDLSARLQDRLPTPGPRLAPQIFALLHSEHGAGVREWLGAALAEGLAHAAPPAYAALAASFDAQPQPVQGPGPGDWQQFILPVFLGPLPSPLRITTRRRGGTRRGRDEGERFLLELSFSQLGALQLDGLMRRKAKAKQFDLVIRSDKELPGEIRRDVDALFRNSLLAFGMEGSLRFLAAEPFIAIPPLQDAASGIIFA